MIITKTDEKIIKKYKIEELYELLETAKIVEIEYAELGYVLDNKEFNSFKYKNFYIYENVIIKYLNSEKITMIGYWEDEISYRILIDEELYNHGLSYFDNENKHYWKDKRLK